MIGGIPVGLARPLGMSSMINGESDRILVLIQLNGGNDGLNTVMQLDNYDVLDNLRSNIQIPENKLLKLSDKNALHPSMTGVRSLYDEGMVRIIQNVGYADQNRSHFRSTDIWHTASDSDEMIDTGWLGRYLGSTHSDYPDGYPNSDCPDPLAITIGNFVSETCQGTATNFSIAVGNIDQIGTLDDPSGGSLPDNCYGREMEFLIEAIQKTNAYAARLTEAAENGMNSGPGYPDGNRFAQQLMTTARLISGGLQTKIYIVSLGGFDTHADQVQGNDPEQGFHAELLQSLSDTIKAFYDDMRAQGYADKILCMTYSEFGRQIRSNASFGTDHGTAAPMLIFGDCVEGGILGDNIPIDPATDPQAGVPMQFDFRDVYGTVLEKWFGVSDPQIRQFLHSEYMPLPVFTEDCLLSSVEEQINLSESAVSLWPNPASSNLHIEITAADGPIEQLEIFNSTGARVFVSRPAAFVFSIPVQTLRSGRYFVRVTSKKGFTVKPLIKI